MQAITMVVLIRLSNLGLIDINFCLQEMHSSLLVFI